MRPCLRISPKPEQYSLVGSVPSRVKFISCIQSFQLPISASGLLVEDILLAVSRDKKKDADKIRFILLNGIGNAVIDTNVTEQEMAEACEFIL